MGKAEAPRKQDRILALSEAAGEHALDERYAKFMDDIKLDEGGTFAGGKRSQYDGKKNLGFGGGVGTASYQRSRYHVPEWTGRAEARTGTYSGNTDGSRYHATSRFQGTSATQTAQRSRFDREQARRSTYKTNRASESTTKPVGKPTDALTDFRRRDYPEPHIMSQADYDRMTVEQTRSILGRDD